MDKILVIDDTTSIVSPWKAALGMEYKLISCVGWFEAQARFRENVDIMIVIINLSLQYINGLDAVAKIRSKNMGIPIIILAKAEDAKLVQSAKTYNIQEVESIPVDINFMLHKVHKYAPITPAETDSPPASQSDTKTATRDSLNDDDVKGKYYSAQSLMANSDYDGAIKVYDEIINEKKLKDTHLKYLEEAIFQTGRCYMKKTDYSKAVEAFKMFIVRAPKSMLTRQALFHIGQSYEEIADTAKAINFYSKIISLNNTDSLATQTRKQLFKLQGKA